MAFVVGRVCNIMMMMRVEEKREKKIFPFSIIFSFLSHELQKAMNVVFPTLFCSQSFPSNDHERMCCRGNFKLCNQNFDKDFVSEKKLYRKVDSASRNLTQKWWKRTKWLTHKKLFKEFAKNVKGKDTKNDVQYDVKIFFKSLHNYRTDKKYLFCW